MSTYIEANLIRGEAVVYEAKPHWILFVSWRSALTLGLLPLIDYWTSEFAVTNKRVIMKMGWISRRVLELNLHKIESVNVDQSLLGRLLGYGTITVIGTGGTRETFDRIAHPLVFRKAFQEQEGEFEDRLDAQRASSTRHPFIVRRLVDAGHGTPAPHCGRDGAQGGSSGADGLN